MDLSGCAASMKPPCPSLELTTAVECSPAEVCLKEARVEPVCMSWRAIVPGPVAVVVGCVEHNIISCSCMFLDYTEYRLRGDLSKSRDLKL